MESSSTSTPVRKRLEPALVILFGFFLIIFVANGFLIYFASSSWTGLVSHDHYREGLEYNETLARHQAQESLGWNTELDTSRLAPGQKGMIQFSMHDKEMRPITGATLTGVLYRPVQEAQDLAFTLDETAPGVYNAGLTATSPGHWGVKITAKVRGEEYLKDLRFFLAPTPSER